MLMPELDYDPSSETWREIMDSPHRYTYPGTAPTNEDPWALAPSIRDVDNINLPPHYRMLPVECIDVTEHFNFTLGNAIKYIWRADFKGKPVEDLKKAVWYLEREIARRERDSAL